MLAIVAISSAFISCSSDDDDNENKEVVVSSTDALMLESFVLDGMEPTITRASADEDFPEIKFLVRFKNNALPREKRKYDVGAALYDAAKNKVATYTLYNDVELTAEKDYKMDDKVVISKDIKDGTYQLKPICKISGKEEWEDFQLADELAMTITIAGNKVQIEEALETKGILQVKNFSFDNNFVAQNEPFKVTLTLFCRNIKSSVPVYVAKQNYNGTYSKLTGATWTPNASGEGKVTLSYAPSESGKHTYYVISALSDEPITQFDVITKGQLFDFTIDNIANEDDNTLADNSIKGTFIVENFDESTFSQDMYMMLGTLDMNTFELSVDTFFTKPENYQLMHLSTSGMGEEKVVFSFNNLNYDSYYTIDFGIKDESGKFQSTSGDRLQFIYTTASEESLPGITHDREETRMAKSPAIDFVKGKKIFVIKK